MLCVLEHPLLGLWLTFLGFSRKIPKLAKGKHCLAPLAKRCLCYQTLECVSERGRAGDGIFLSFGPFLFESLGLTFSLL